MAAKPATAREQFPHSLAQRIDVRFGKVTVLGSHTIMRVTGRSGPGCRSELGCEVGHDEDLELTANAAKFREPNQA